MTFELSRRGFLGSIIAACVAPAIVRSGLIMPIKPSLVIANEIQGELVGQVEVHLPGFGMAWVRVNGEMLGVRRGAPTLVPEHYYQALRNSNEEMRWKEGGSPFLVDGCQVKDHVLNDSLKVAGFRSFDKLSDCDTDWSRPQLFAGPVPS